MKCACVSVFVIIHPTTSLYKSLIHLFNVFELLSKPYGFKRRKTYFPHLKSTGNIMDLVNCCIKFYIEFNAEIGINNLSIGQPDK